MLRRVTLEIYGFCRRRIVTSAFAQTGHFGQWKGAEQWEPGIEQIAATATIDPRQPACMVISVDYVIRDKNYPDNPVYPFYLKS